MRKENLIESKIIYLVDNKLNTYTLLNATYRRSKKIERSDGRFMTNEKMDNRIS